MLTPEDINLIERDGNLPQLRALLDPALYTQLIEHCAPQPDVAQVGLTYLRYKPGVNCIAGYEYQADGQKKFCYTKIFATGQSGKGRKFIEKAGTRAAEGISFAFFPNDSRLRSLKKFDGAVQEQQLLARLFRDCEDLQDGMIQPIRYKPERRFVARLVVEGQNRAVVKMHTPRSFASLRRNHKAFRSQGNLNIARRIGCSDRHNVLAYEWLEGDLLSDKIRAGIIEPALLKGVGEAIAQVHKQTGRGLVYFSPAMEAEQVNAIAEQFVKLWPDLSDTVYSLANRIGALLSEPSTSTTPIHGDFYAKQVLLRGDEVGVLDFDESAIGDPMTDVGNFIAHLERDQSRYALTAEQVDACRDALVEGYAGAGMPVRAKRLAVMQAANLFKLIPHPFRFRERDWPAQTRLLLDRIEQTLVQAQRQDIYMSGDGIKESISATAADDTQMKTALIDPALPFLNKALEVETAQAPVASAIESVLPDSRVLSMTSIKLLRHKMSRRCLIAYDLQMQQAESSEYLQSVLGKARYKKVKTSNYAIVESLWQGAFGNNATDGIHVPRPLGMVPAFNMWLQEKINGVTVTEYLNATGSERVAQKAAQALYKLHTHGPEADRIHSLEDELTILENRLRKVADTLPALRGRIEKVLAGCLSLAAMLPDTRLTPVHRDFYPDNVLVGKDKIYLIDLDLYCMGAPAMDAGNFIGHVIEYSLRTFGDPGRLDSFADAFENAYMDMAGDERQRRAILIYTTLTLARHIQISTLFENRRAFTPDILALCEQRLARHIAPALIC